MKLISKSKIREFLKIKNQLN